MNRQHDVSSLFLAVASSDFSTGTASAIIKGDIDKLPWGSLENDIKLTNIEKIYFEDIFGILWDFKSKGEKSSAVKPVCNEEINDYVSIYCRVLNELYAAKDKVFRRGDVTEIDKGNFLSTIFYYGKQKDLSQIAVSDLNDLMEHQAGNAHIIRRIVKFYGDGYIIFIKPNERRFWLKSIAIRDADETVNDFLQGGF